MKPKLRFKEFSDEYVLSDLGKYLIQYKKTTNSNNQYPVLTSSRSGIFFQEDYFNRQVASKDNTGYNIVPRNYFTYRHMSDDTIFSFNINTLCDYGIVSTLYPVFTTNTEMNSNYLKEYLNNSKRFSEYCLLQKQGGSRTYMYFDKLKKFVGCFPSIQEQTKVSNFLSLIDKKIDLQSKKIEDLKLFKKGLILSLKKNSFDWHTVCIKDLFKITRGVVIPKNELSEFKNGEYKYPVYSSQTSNQGILGYSDTFDFNGKYLTWTTDGANAGKVFYRNGKFRCTNVCGVLYEDNIKFTNELFAELLNYETPKHVSYVGNPKLMNNVMADIKIKIPNGDVQENTSLIINTINNKVNLEKNKLLKFKELKKGLMQNMFV